MIEGLLPDLEVVRKDFPILARTLADGRPLVYLDSANTSQKPQVVIDTMVDHLERHNANIARAMHQLGAEATAAYESARDKVAAFVGAPERDEVVFTKNASEALNLAANTLAWRGERQVGPGDEIVITEMEHHSNIVPWQLLCERTGATLRWFGLTEDGRLDLANVDELITERTKVVSLTWVSNMLGTINPIGDIARRAHAVGALVVVDGSQAAPQLPIDLAAMPDDERPDLLAFTGHKAVGPTGIGVLWGRRTVLDELPPFLGGGEMIETVTMERSTYAPVPHKFEAGTPPIVEAVGLGAAVGYLGELGMDAVHAHERAVTAYALEGLATVPGLTVLGPLDAARRGGAISFELAGVHPHDVGAVVVVDGAQSAPHLRVDLQAIDCDFFACSGHKLYGPTGIGLLYGKKALLEGMPPWQGGGGMIREVHIDRSTYALPPERFEAGTPPIAEVIGLGATLDYVSAWDWNGLVAYEQELVAEAAKKLAEVPGLRILGEGADRVSVLSFVLDGIHPHDAGTVLDTLGIAVRAGHHCAQPLMRRFGVTATIRASFGAYNTHAEVDALIDGLAQVRKVFAG